MTHNEYFGKIIDTHAHIYPEKIAVKAVKTIGDFYGYPMECQSGLTENLLRNGGLIGVRKYIVHSTATSPKQVRSINEYICGETRKEPRFAGLITLHPELTRREADAEADFALSHGLKGIKLHPDFQKFRIDDERVFHLYEAAEGRLPILFHTGDPRYAYSQPEKLANVARRFPGLRCIGAHFGGHAEWERVECYADTPNVHFDTCSSLFLLNAGRAKEIIELLGADRFMFGSDFPMWRHDLELERVLRLELREDILEKILWKNAEKFYGI
jgi:predicted TIM-barrel fold metal-dependent hydrolase